MKKVITLLLLCFLIVLYFVKGFTCDLSLREILTQEKIEEIKFETDEGEVLELVDSVRFERDSVIIPEFSIRVELSEDAVIELRQKKESIIVQAYFRDLQMYSENDDYVEYESIGIGSHKVELLNSKIALFKNIKFSKEEYHSLSDSNFEVLINVFSGRRSVNSNLLDCGILQQRIDSIKGKEYLLKCKLIWSEND